MCGIIGYVGDSEAYPILVEGLKRLEYRGYDSAGIITSDKKFHMKKDVGRISRIFTLSGGVLPGKRGIAHTRWATHGGVTRENAHPHLSCDGSIAVVHNGIIENFDELKESLEKKGHKFSSDTDTEVIAHLIEDSHSDDKKLVEAVFDAMNQMKGSFTFLVLDRETDDLIAARKDSPLVVGVGDGENFVASDIPAFLKYTKRAIFLDNYHVALLNKEYVHVFDAVTGEALEPDIKEVRWDISMAEKNGRPHFMLKEIEEQRETIKAAINQDSGGINRVADMINSAQGVFFIACGTSYHACLCASYVFSKIAKKHVNTVLASEFPNYEHFIKKGTLVVAVSQSGETADVLYSVEKAKKRGATVLSIVNVMGSTLMRISDHSLLINAGPEICVLATKSYTSQLALLLMIAYATIGKLESGRDELRKISDRVGDIIDNMEYINDLANELKDKENMFLIGRGVSYATALEAALKLKEVTYIHAEGLAGGELKHGTLALIEEGVPCIVFAPDDDTRTDIISNAHEIKARGGYIIGISPKKDKVFDFFIPVPTASEAHPILMIVPIQMLAYNLAVLRGCDPDKPRNLAKSVTVK